MRIKIIMAIMMVAVFAHAEPVDLDKVLEHLIEVENPRRDPNAVGDKHMTNKAYGLLQIRKPYLDDANRVAKTDYTIQDVKNEAIAKSVAKAYLTHYGKFYTRKTGNQPTIEVYARIHNGGPYGWRKSSTDPYVKKLEKVMK